MRVVVDRAKGQWGQKANGWMRDSKLYNTDDKKTFRYDAKWMPVRRWRGKQSLEMPVVYRRMMCMQ